MKKFLGLISIFSVLLAACSGSMSQDDISNQKTLKNKSGILGVVETSQGKPEEVCGKVKGSLVLVKEETEKKIIFYPNQVFGTLLSPGKYKVTDAKYLCVEKYDNGVTRHGFDADFNENVYITIPQYGFCKIAFLVEDEFQIRHDNSFFQKENSENFEEVPFCTISNDDTYHKTEEPVKGNKPSNLLNSVYESAEWVAMNAGNSEVKVSTANAESGMGRKGQLEYTLSSTTDVASVGMSIAFDEKLDLSSCRDLSFDYKGASSLFYVSGTDYGESFVTLPISLEMTDSWRRVTIPWSSLEVEGEIKRNRFDKNVVGFGWKINGYVGSRGVLEVDNISCEN